MRQNRQWRIAANPVGMIQTADFKWETEPVPTPGKNEILVRTIYLSLDPSDRIMAQALPVGTVMLGMAVGVVEQSQNPDFEVGDRVRGMLGWQDYCLSTGAGLTKLPKDLAHPFVDYLGLFGIIGPTAYVGLFNIAKPKPGETLVVSAAAGAVGSLVGQMGKIAGCRVVGIAGSDEKCAWITHQLGFDAAINYKTEPLIPRLRETCPQGIDVYFDNVSGEILDTVLGLINPKARVVLCGFISQYNAVDPGPGPVHFNNLMVQRARAEGFLIWDHMDRFAEAYAAIEKWLAEGKLQAPIDMVDGLENAPRAIQRLFGGPHQGKLIVQVSQEA